VDQGHPEPRRVFEVAYVPAVTAARCGDGRSGGLDIRGKRYIPAISLILAHLFGTLPGRVAMACLETIFLGFHSARVLGGPVWGFHRGKSRTSRAGERSSGEVDGRGFITTMQCLRGFRVRLSVRDEIRAIVPAKGRQNKPPKRGGDWADTPLPYKRGELSTPALHVGGGSPGGWKQRRHSMATGRRT